jgi:hypothetical protein
MVQIEFNDKLRRGHFAKNVGRFINIENLFKIYLSKIAVLAFHYNKSNSVTFWSSYDQNDNLI